MSRLASLDITTDRDSGGQIRLIASGELDIATCELLDVAIRSAATETGRTIVDLRELDFCDSSGLALLLRARRRHPSLTILPGDSLMRLAKLARVEAQLFGA